MNKKKVKKVLIKSGIGTLVFAASLAGAYLLTPAKVRKRVFELSQNTENEFNDNANHFGEFVARFSADTGLTSTDEPERERSYYGMQIDFDNLALSFKKDSNSSLNYIKIDGGIDFLMRGLKDINFNIDVNVDYNSKVVPLNISYVDKTAYFGIKNLRMKATSTTFDELIGDYENGVNGLLYDYFMASKEEGGINFDIETFAGDKLNGLIDGLIGSLDFNSLMSSGMSFSKIDDDQEGMGLDVKERETTNGWDFDITLQIHNLNKDTNEMDNTDINAIISTDKDYRLTRVDLGELSFGNFTISGALDIDTIKDLTIYTPDNAEYRKYNSAYNYVEVINYKGWLEKLANFLDEENQKFGVEFSLDLASDTTEIGKINGSINADLSKLIDITDYEYVPSGNSPLSKKQKGLIDTIRSDVELGIELDILGQHDEEYCNLAINYNDGAGYLNLNETLIPGNEPVSVIKAKIDTETVNWLIDELPGMFASLSGDTNATSSLFSFITDSSLMSSIKSGDYSSILDLLKTLRNDEDKIEIGLDLSSLGIGNDAEVNLTLDSRTGVNNKVLNLDVSNVKIGSFGLDVAMNTSEFKNVEISNEETYDSLSFLPTVFDQVNSILDTKQAGFAIEGTVLDANYLGLRINGNGQFDYGTRYGFGNLQIDQYKYENKGVWYSHKIALDVDNRSSNYSNNNAYFVYGDTATEDNIRGKVTVQSVLDIVDVIKTFLNENKDDPRFTKFIEPIMKMMSLGVLGDVINSKDYFRLLKNDLVKSAKKTGDNLDLLIGGELFSLNSDIDIRVVLKEGKIDSLQVVDLALSSEKKLNLKLSLNDFDNEKLSPIDSSKAYIDFSSIALLLKFGINTTKNNYYHLNADINLNALLIINLDFQLEVYIVVKDEYVKIYGVIEDSKISAIAQSYTDIETRSLKSEFTFETYADDDPNKEDGVGGYFHFKTTKTKRITGRQEIEHYKTTSKNLLEGNNILTYLLRGFLLIRPTIMSQIGTLDLSSSGSAEEKEPGDYTNVLNGEGFSYDANNRHWLIGINLDAATGIDALKVLKLDLYGSQYENLKKLSAELNVQASLVSIKVTADIALENPDPSITDWSSSLQSSFNAINGVNFPAAKLNNPEAYINY